MMATAGFVRTESLWNDPSYYNLSVSSYEPIFPPDVQRQYDAAELLHVTIPSYTGYGPESFPVCFDNHSNHSAHNPFQPKQQAKKRLDG